MDTKEKLLNIAFEEIYANGYEAASINAILKKANINKGSMYHYFKSKKELTLAIIDYNVNEYMKIKYGSILNVESNYIDEMLKVFRTRDKYNIFCGCRLNNLVQELSHKDKEFKDALEQVYFMFEGLIEEVVKKAIEKKEIVHKNPKQLAIFIVAALEGCLATAKKSQDQMIFLDCMDELEIYLKSLQP